VKFSLIYIFCRACVLYLACCMLFDQANTTW